jgi:hypothetical protein
MSNIKPCVLYFYHHPTYISLPTISSLKFIRKIYMWCYMYFLSVQSNSLMSINLKKNLKHHILKVFPKFHSFFITKFWFVFVADSFLHQPASMQTSSLLQFSFT